MGCKYSRYFFYVKIFNPLDKSRLKTSVEAYNFESLKCLNYEQRILDVEKSNFVQLGFPVWGKQERLQRALQNN